MVITNLKKLSRNFKGIPELSQRTKERLLTSLKEQIIEKLKKGERVGLFGLGLLRIVFRGSYKSRHIRTGEIIIIPEHRVIKFKPARGLKKLLN